MVQIAFFLRFRRQLQYTRPNLISRLENTVVQAAREAGGKISTDRSLIKAAFDDNSPGFWLDMLILTETITRAIEENAIDLYGYSLLIGKSLPNIPSYLCRLLACADGGIYLDQNAARALQPYLKVDDQGKPVSREDRYGEKAFSRLWEIKTFIPTATVGLSLRETITTVPG